MRSLRSCGGHHLAERDAAASTLCAALCIKLDSALNTLCGAPHNVLVVMMVERFWLWRVEIT